MPAGAVYKCTRCAVRHQPIVRNALRTALIVGTILTLINQGDVLLQGARSVGILAKMALTYTVPVPRVHHRRPVRVAR